MSQANQSAIAIVREREIDPLRFSKRINRSMVHERIPDHLQAVERIYAMPTLRGVVVVFRFKTPDLLDSEQISTIEWVLNEISANPHGRRIILVEE